MHISTTITYSLKRRKWEKSDGWVEFKLLIIDVTSALRWIEVAGASNMGARLLLELVGAEQAHVQETFF